MQFRRIIATTALAAALSFNGAMRADAGDKPAGVVELFTSQGCNSCPPADAIFSELVSKGQVIALAYHVDYWDYLGWRDTLARPENGDRQNSYMKSLGTRAVYTPQVIINGRTHINGTNRAGIDADLEAQSREGKGLTVSIKVTERADSIVIRAGATTEPQAEANLVLVFFSGPQSIAVSRGDNTGQTTTYFNAVTEVRTAGMWHGKVTEYELPKSEFVGKGGSVALLQTTSRDGDPGPIIGAVVISKP